ncbi:hypothetical protein [Microbacterium sp. B35-30]|uniref:hypothetical protein n=1 Tax=Microbacterium sp. B35-30 TaxID=1962642 RepID=UPI0013D1F96C|nr:hypothetical protein [Microbacterium sp. B35-30]
MASAPPPPAPAPAPAPTPAKPTLTLSAVVPPKPPVTAPLPLTAVAPGVAVRFTVSSTLPITAPALKSGSVPIEATFVNAERAARATEWVANVTFATQPANDVYATAGEGADAVMSPAMRVTVGAPSPAPPGNGAGGVAGPAEVAVGEYDADFARRTGAVFRGLAYLFAGLAAWMLLWILPMGGLADEATDITDRVVAAASTIALAVGVIAILAGVWMALLEARGRQRARVALAEGGFRGAGGGLGMSIADVEKLAAALSKVRGTIAAFVIGVLLIVLGLAALTVDQLVPDPAATTQTEEPEQTGDDEP